MSVLDELKIKLGWDVDTKSLDQAGQKTQALAKQTQTDWAAVGKTLKTGFLAAAAAVTAAAAAVTAFTNQMADQLNEIDKTSRALGITAKEYQQLKFAMGQAGLEAGSLKSGLEKFNAAVNDARLNGTGPFADSVRQLGMRIEDFDNLSVSDQLAKFADGFSLLTDETTKTGIAQKVLTTDFIGLLEGGGAAMRELTAEAERLGLASDDQIAKAAALKDAMGRFEQTLFSIKATIAEELFPWFQASAEGMREWLAENREWLKSGLQEGMQKLGEYSREVFQALSAVWEVVGPFVKELAGSSFKMAVDRFRDLGTILKVINGIIILVSKALAQLRDYLGEVWDRFTDGTLGKAIDWVANKFEKLANAIGTVADGIRDVLDLFISMAEDNEALVIGDISRGRERYASSINIPNAEPISRKGGGLKKVTAAQERELRKAALKEALEAGATKAEAEEYANAKVAESKKKKGSKSNKVTIKKDIRSKYEKVLKYLAQDTGLSSGAVDKALAAVQGQLKEGAVEDVALKSGIGVLSGLSGKDLQTKYEQYNNTLAGLTGDLRQPDLPLSEVTRGTQPQVLTSIINNNFSFDNKFNIDGAGDPNAVGQSIVESFRTYFQETVEATSRSVKVNFAR